MPNSALPRAGRRRAAASLVTVLLGSVAGAAACAGPAGQDSARGTDALARPKEHAPSVAAATTVPTVVVYKSPTCGCCANWVEHMQAHGFPVEVHDTADLAPVKAAHGVTERLGSCHTALVGGYVVEGHVPVEDVRRLLRERPAVAGLAAPGMPVGSPGMEMPGTPGDRYDVLAFERGGAERVYASHGPQ